MNTVYNETSASVSSFYAKATADFDAVLTYSAPDGTVLTKTLHVSIKDDAALIPTLFSAHSAAAYAERPTPSTTTGKITKVEKVADTWLIWFNGEPAYCCSHGKNGQPTGCPTYSYAYTSTVGSDQFIPGDHYGNQIRIWGGLGQLSLGLLAERHTDAEEAAAYAARNATAYSTADTAALKYAYCIYDEDQLFVIVHFPESQAARLYLDGARAAMGQLAGRAATGDIQKVAMQDDYTKVEISKQDLTTGRELPGATLRISDQDGKTIAEWIIDGQPHRIDRLAPGNYILTEFSAPKGYRLSESVPFTVQESGEIQRVTMYDTSIGVPTVSKRDAANNAPLPGASLVIRDADGRTVDHWLTTDADHAVAVLSEAAAAKDPRTNVVLLSDDTTEHVYVLVEEAAPAGYHLAGDLTFKVMELDGELVLFLHDGSGWQRAGTATLTMLDERTPDYTPEQPGKQFPQTGALF